MRANAAASFSCDERSACPRAFAIEVHRTMSHLPLLGGTQSLWIEISEQYRSFDSGGPAVMEPLIELFRPETLRRHLSMALPLSLIAVRTSARDSNGSM